MSLRIFSVLSQNLLSKKKKKAKETREYGVKWKWFGGRQQSKEQNALVYQMADFH